MKLSLMKTKKARNLGRRRSVPFNLLSAKPEPSPPPMPAKSTTELPSSVHQLIYSFGLGRKGEEAGPEPPRKDSQLC